MTFQHVLRIERFAAGLWLTSMAVAYSNSGVAFPLWMTLFVWTLAIGLWWILRMTAAWMSARVRREAWQSRLLIPMALTAGITLATTPWMLILRVRLSEDALVIAAPRLAQIPAATLFRDGEQVGLFTVSAFEYVDDELRFVTSGCGLVDQCGVVYSPARPPLRRGKDSFRHLYGPWWHLYQSF